jgi:hypothetical protein
MYVVYSQLHVQPISIYCSTLTPSSTNGLDYSKPASDVDQFSERSTKETIDVEHRIQKSARDRQVLSSICGVYNIVLRQSLFGVTSEKIYTLRGI